MEQMQMFAVVATETPCYLVLISTATGVYRSYIDTSDREEARAAGHLIASESLGLEAEDYNISVSQATRRVFN